MKEQPFYIGQKVVCIKNATWGDPKIGNQYVVTKLILSPCCGFWYVGYGEKCIGKLRHLTCHQCGKVHPPISDEYLVHQRHFAPIQEGFEAISFERVMEEEKVSVN